MNAPVKSYLVGLDLGQAQDHSALVILEQTTASRKGFDPVHCYALRYLQRWELNTPYTDIVEHVSRLMNRAPLPGAALCVDATGVGRAVVDLFRKAKLPARLVPITITGGHTMTRVQGGFHVPKKDLVGIMQALLQSRRLRFAADLPQTAVLLKELAAFRVKMTLATGNETFEAWRERDHDDLVLALAIPCWYAERPRHRVGVMCVR